MTLPTAAIEARNDEPWVVLYKPDLVWWKPERAGYTDSLDHAGVYTQQQAMQCGASRSERMPDGSRVDDAMPLRDAVRLKAEMDFVSGPRAGSVYDWRQKRDDALLAEVAALREQLTQSQAYADKLPNDITLLEVGNLSMATQLAEIETIVRGVCPVENNDDRMTDDDPAPTEEALSRYLCQDDHGNDIVDADTLADAISQIVGCWHSCADAIAELEKKVTALQSREVVAVVVRLPNGGESLQWARLEPVLTSPERQSINLVAQGGP